jgi:hypothetical protein
MTGIFCEKDEAYFKDHARLFKNLSIPVILVEGFGDMKPL